MKFILRFPLLAGLGLLLSAPLSQAESEPEIAEQHKPHPVPGQPWWQVKCNVYTLRNDDGLFLTNQMDSKTGLPKLVKAGTGKKEDTWWIKEFPAGYTGKSGNQCDNGSEQLTLSSYPWRFAKKLVAAWNNGNSIVKVQSGVPEGLKYTQLDPSLNLCMGPAKNGVKKMVSFKNMFENFYLMMAGSPSGGFLTVANNPPPRMSELVSWWWEPVPGFPECSPTSAPTLHPTPAPTPLPTRNPTPAPVIPPAADCGLVRFQTWNRLAAIQHQDYKGKIIRSSPYHQDSWFYIRTCHHDLGNCGSDPCVSLESYNYKNYWLRHANRNIWMNQYEDRDLFHKDASWCMRKAPNGMYGGIAFESVNYPGEFISNFNQGNLLKIQHVDLGNRDQKKAASFNKQKIKCPKCVSLNTINVGKGNKHFTMRHEGSKFYAKQIYDENTKFWVRPCAWGNKETCGGSQCISLESINNRGSFVRHSSGKIYLDRYSSSDRFRKDASWCVKRHNRPGNWPGWNNAEYVSLESAEFKNAHLESGWMWTYDTQKNPLVGNIPGLDLDKKYNYRPDKEKEGVWLRDLHKSYQGRFHSDYRYSLWWIMSVRSDCGDDRNRRLQLSDELLSSNSTKMTVGGLRGSRGRGDEEGHPQELSSWEATDLFNSLVPLDSFGTPGFPEFDEEEDWDGNFTALTEFDN